MPARTKRTLQEALDQNGGDLFGQYDEAYSHQIIDQNADQIRRKIRTFLDSGAMTTGEFQSAIHVNSRAWHMFMSQSGKEKGMGSTVFQNAWVYFKARDEKGLKMPRKPKAGASSADGGAKKGKGQENGEKPEGPPSVDDVVLDGQETGKIPVYDNPEEIRRKITLHLRLPGVTQAAFLRELAKQLPEEGRKIQGKQLTDFRRQSGENGNTSCVFYSAYVYFEKLRIKEKRAKTKHREDMEKKLGKKGVDRETQHYLPVWVICGPGERPEDFL